MKSTASDFSTLRSRLAEIQAGLKEHDLDGWLLYDLHARNPVATQLLGVGELTRRYFVLVPAEGEPTVLMHGIETTPWAAWPWRKQTYVAWKTLDARLAELLGGKKVATEISTNDAVPAVDMIPAGVAELLRKAGAELTASADLITRFYARWTDEQAASHRRAAAVLAEVARETFQRAAEAVGAGRPVTEGELHGWLLARLADRGIGTGPDAIVANGVNAANPHYENGPDGATLEKGDLLLIDLWSRESESAVYADQTWMGYLGSAVPEDVQRYWEAIRDARDAAVEFLHEEWSAGRIVQGWQVDDVTRDVIRERGLDEYFIHRTGHSIDQDVHGMGPNIDNLETHETRKLIPGVGFSIEPGIYVPGEVGLRTEIDVFMSEDGPEVTTPDPQTEIFTLLP
ncbi:MAG: M24 family metallopeptidase [Gemmatimonadetes bacterium]|nr:aminopeptidase P family protein [Gemmatimonadota bacterium]NIQ57703.1 aminopeptidase P family protein [Gemmatimonadota bacterium]NIU77870.1 M24 family metallopeptidase [Gammaproteobacteria bacterium]NIX46985.1 M24 family metallopeptidase [Gemmatimonadota bacterium]NIY11344.1 M24 family metallopeptidase [Gemmatimonadota bacterium]